MVRQCILLVLIIGSSLTFSQNQVKSFEALCGYDYFKARQLFYKDLKKKNDAASAYGLAVIYGRNDNPFTNLDSAVKYANRAFAYFRFQPLKQRYCDHVIDSSTLLRLCDSIAWKSLKKLEGNNISSKFDEFLSEHYLADKKLLEQVIYRRDELDFKLAKMANSSDSTARFMLTHPESEFLAEAAALKYRQLFEEETKLKTEAQYLNFIEKYPGHAMLNAAYEFLFEYYKKRSDIEGLRKFVRKFPSAPQINEAWKLLFSLSVRSFSSAELLGFMQDHPAYPDQNFLLKELSLSKLQLFPFEKDDFFGFIDSTGRIVVPPVYDSISEFHNGLSVVSRNDSVFFINKENVNVFGRIFAEAYAFKEGLAAVKKNDQWNFINRHGQVVGNIYEDISEPNDNVYVVKQKGKYGALDFSAQMIIEASYDKLGDFKNGYAYFVENNKYGFVNKKGLDIKATYSWISDFNDKGVAVYKENDAYGLINGEGKRLLEPNYDLILKAANNFFVLVKGSNYGFYSGEGCFLTPVAYDFLKQKPAEFYTNGVLLRLLKKNEQALLDQNNNVKIAFGLYEETNFEAGGLYRVKKKGKYGYVDKKLNLLIPLKYDQADDFADGLAIVKIKNKTALIDISGKEVFATEGSLEKVTPHYFLEDDEQKNVINWKGEKVFNNVLEVQTIGGRRLAITLTNNKIKLIKD